MDINSFEAAIKSQKLKKKVYVFGGPDEFLKDRSFQKLIKELIPDDETADNLSRFTCSTKNKDLILSSIFGFSFNDSPRVFLLSSPEAIPAKPRKAFFESISKNGIPDMTFLIISTTEARIVTELTKIFGIQSEKIDFWTPFENQLPAWVSKEARELGIKITKDAAVMLLDKTGNSLSLVYQELVKLGLALGKKTIDKAQVEQFVSYARQDTVFDLLEYIGMRRPLAAMKAVESLIHKNEAPQKIWFMICKQLREFRLFHDLSTDRPDLMQPIINDFKKMLSLNGQSDFKANQERKSIGIRLQNVADELPSHIDKAISLKQKSKQKNLSMALNYSREELLNAWSEMIATDKAMKNGSIDFKTTIQRFIVSFVSGN